MVTWSMEFLLRIGVVLLLIFIVGCAPVSEELQKTGASPEWGFPFQVVAQDKCVTNGLLL